MPSCLFSEHLPSQLKRHSSMLLLKRESRDFSQANLAVTPKLLICIFSFLLHSLLTDSAGELIFQAKRDTASYLKELAKEGKISYTLVVTGSNLSRDSSDII